jgi:hypothetical protein
MSERLMHRGAAMLNVEASIVIDRPLETVFAFVADLENKSHVGEQLRRG